MANLCTCCYIVLVLILVICYTIYYNYVTVPYQEFLLDSRELRTKAQFYLKTDTCTNPNNLAQLENYNLCAVSRRRNETSPEDIAYTMLLEQWKICDNGKCTIASIDIGESFRAYLGVIYWGMFFGIVLSVGLLCSSIFNQKITAMQMPMSVQGGYMNNMMAMNYHQQMHINNQLDMQNRESHSYDQRQLSGGSTTMFLGNGGHSLDDMRHKKRD